MNINGKAVSELRAEAEVQQEMLEGEIEHLYENIRVKKEMLTHVLRKIRNLDILVELEKTTDSITPESGF